MSEGWRGGEEEGCFTRPEPQIDGVEGSWIGGTGEEVGGGVRMGVAVATDVSWRFADAVKKRV